jgi:hypothetical protein
MRTANKFEIFIGERNLLMAAAPMFDRFKIKRQKMLKSGQHLLVRRC